MKSGLRRKRRHEQRQEAWRRREALKRAVMRGRKLDALSRQTVIKGLLAAEEKHGSTE